MILAALSLLLTQAAEPEQHRFVFLGAGRFAQYADLASLHPAGAGGRIRVLQVVEPDFRAGGDAYWGGWSWWSFDCDSGSVDRLDFASVREGGAEGPATADAAPAYEAAPGGDAHELLVAACNPGDYATDAATLEEAVAHGRAQLAL
ncbi:hypothetical protein [Brevundimonas sp. Root1279]|uniref:hypothetical protein n=1 Tax=Brevundimonas sp. Root1279 TaxID=1736443 RepID=UPI0006F23ECD|nr:hypothetical protein [Brevundimonas sp. Root1279]KQW83169.1 hypothetical protein ASC65_07540 [Brevundimonas sp. Root1279]